MILNWYLISFLCITGAIADTGNEKVLTAIKITGNELYQPSVTKEKRKAIVDYNAKEQMVFYYETHEECMKQCITRYILDLSNC